MSFIEDIAREALKIAYENRIKAQRSVMLGAGLLALIHLLTVYPYLEVSTEIVVLEGSMAANTALVSRLDPEIERLKVAGKSAGERLDELLSRTTEEMIHNFGHLRNLVQRHLEGELSDAERPSDASDAPLQQMQQMQIPQMQQMPRSALMQGQVMNMPAPSVNMPAPSVVRGLDTFGPELTEVLEALSAGEPDADERLITYARSNIVEAAYARAQRGWSEHIRPAYLSALAAIEKGARRAAEDAPELAAEITTALLSASDELAAQRAVVEAIEISPNTAVDEALLADWWSTVEGKGAFADAVAESITRQMGEISETAAVPSAAIRKTLVLQQELRGKLVATQQELERQFANQHKQLVSLSGAMGVVPIDLDSFIGIYPLVLGLVLGLLLLRIGQARREAALASADLALAAPGDRETRVWLTRRALGGGDALHPLLVTFALALGTVLWIALAAQQVGDSPIVPLLSPWTSGTLATLVVLAVSLWDAAAIRKLAADIKR